MIVRKILIFLVLFLCGDPVQYVSHLSLCGFKSTEINCHMDKKLL